MCLLEWVGVGEGDKRGKQGGNAVASGTHVLDRHNNLLTAVDDQGQHSQPETTALQAECNMSFLCVIVIVTSLTSGDDANHTQQAQEAKQSHNSLLPHGQGHQAVGLHNSQGLCHLLGRHLHGLNLSGLRGSDSHTLQRWRQQSVAGRVSSNRVEAASHRLHSKICSGTTTQ